jgi:hypothetical protein
MSRGDIMMARTRWDYFVEFCKDGFCAMVSFVVVLLVWGLISAVVLGLIVLYIFWERLCGWIGL